MRNTVLAVAGIALLMAAVAQADDNSSLRAIGEGRALYLTHCASCHGTDAHGLTAPGLDGIASRDGALSRTHLANHVAGRRDGLASGTMPAWNRVFERSWPRGAGPAALKTWKLVKYLEFVQADRPQVASAAPR